MPMTRAPAVVLSAVLLCACGGAPPAPGPVAGPPLVTRAEASGYLETTRYHEVVALMQAAARRSPVIHFTTYGRTAEGRPMPLAVVGNLASGSSRAVRASGRTVLYLQGNIHAGEVEGKEVLLMLLREFAEGAHANLLDSLVLLIGPIYNADGNERLGVGNRPLQHGPVAGMGTRANAMGLDLNRDHTKLDTPEGRALAAMLTDYDPHGIVDLHTTNGTRHAYHLTWAPPLHPNTPAGIDGMLRDRWLPEVAARMHERHGWLTWHYGNVPPAEAGRERGWYTFDHRPRFGTTYAGLRNRFAILSEAYAYLTFEDRIRVTRDFVHGIMAWAHDNATGIRLETAAADAEPLVGRSLALTGRFRDGGVQEVLMGEVDEIPSPVSGERMLLRRDTVRPERMPVAIAFEAAETERVPAVYLIPPGMDTVVVRLRAHGIRLVEVPAGTRQVEYFRIDSTSVAERPFQGRTERRTHGAWTPALRELRRGTLAVPMDQPLARLAFTLLEPRSDDGFAAWNLLPWEMDGGGWYPILRIPGD
jgi:hypothetical protein